MGKTLKKIGSVVGKVDPLRGGDAILEKAGLQTATGQGANNILDNGEAAAEQAAADARRAAEAQQAQLAEQARLQAEAAANQLRQQQEAANQQRILAENQSANLSGVNDAPNIVAGGTADASTIADDAKRKRAAGGGLASQLGLNA